MMFWKTAFFFLGRAKGLSMERELAADDCDLIALDAADHDALEGLLRSRGFDPTSRATRRDSSGRIVVWAERLPCYDLPADEARRLRLGLGAASHLALDGDGM
jgi:hypothetical protein